MPLNSPPDSLLGMPKTYAFLLFGIVAGFLIGFLMGRWRRPPQETVGLADGTERLTLPESEAQAAVPPGISLVVNGRTVEVPSAAMAEIQDLIRTKQKIEAIKALREATGLGLAEAKAVMESLEKVIR